MLFIMELLSRFCGQCSVCRKRLSIPRCRSELIDSAWVVIVPGQKCIKKCDDININNKYKSNGPQICTV